MAKARTSFVCNECGSIQPKWLGRCPECQSWDTLKEFKEMALPKSKHSGTSFDPGIVAEATLLADVDQTEVYARYHTGIEELNRVLGGGLVPGAAILLGGEPGMGKSTLLMQVAGKLAQEGKKVLYVTSEESPQQLRQRANRLLGEHLPSNLWVVADAHLTRILEQIGKLRPDVILLDSIQMIWKPELDASPGSTTQLRACTLELITFAKKHQAATFLVGHVTKDGNLAGPKMLEHMVDTVLTFEGDRHHAIRCIRGLKNRFGPTHEIGLFDMTSTGLKELPDGAGILAGRRHTQPGSMIGAAIQGTRAMLMEIQALTVTGFIGQTKRKVSGLDANRLSMLVAVLEKHGGLQLGDQDIFTQVVGGVRLTDPDCDLAVALSIGSAYMKRVLSSYCAVVGEVGLGGEIRAPGMASLRLQEASRMGYTHVMCSKLPQDIELPKDLTLITVGNISDALQHLN